MQKTSQFKTQCKGDITAQQLVL